MQSQKFHIGDILSITTGHLVSPELIDGVYKILNFMTGDNLFTHQLPRASDECRPHLLFQFPQLENVDASGVNPENWKTWLSDQVDEYGEFLEVMPLVSGIHAFKNPIDELEEMVDPEKIIVVSTTPEEAKCFSRN